MPAITLGLALNAKLSFRPVHDPSLPSGNSSSSPKVVSSPSYSSANSPGVCKASQAVELFPSTWPGVVVREARIEDCWEVAETHCSSFFPNYSFPYDLLLKVNRLVGLLSGFSVPDGCMRACLVAVVGNSLGDSLYIGSEDFKIGDLEGKVSLNKGYVAGILTIDTLADYLPRKGPYMRRRSGIAYVSNVAVREKDRRKGIAKKLMAEAETLASRWGCRAIALHCEAGNPGATGLYSGQGFKSIKVPEGAKWPQPKTRPGIQFNFMMKLLKSGNSDVTTKS